MNGNLVLARPPDYVLGITDPYFLDSKTSLGLDLYNTTREYSEFDETKIGFGINSSYPLKDFRFPSSEEVSRSRREARTFGEQRSVDDLGLYA